MASPLRKARLLLVSEVLKERLVELNQQFNEWGIVEVMGHQRYAGHMTEETIGGASFLRVDVPEIEGRPAFTKIIGAGAIFAITPTTEDAARAAAYRFRSVAFESFYLTPAVAALPAPVGAPGDFNDEDFDEDDDLPM
jgi:hypothetical protein